MKMIQCDLCGSTITKYYYIGRMSFAGNTAGYLPRVC